MCKLHQLEDALKGLGMEKSMRKPHSKPPAVSVKQPRAHLQQPLESQDGGGNSFLS